MAFELEKAAFKAGKRIQFKNCTWSTPQWEVTIRPLWSRTCQYRIHPDDLPQPAGTTMNKTDALARLAAMETETAALRKIIEAPEPAPSLLTKPEPVRGSDYWSISSGANGSLRSIDCRASDTRSYADSGVMFQNETLAKAYAEAINTMLLLRHQPGTVKPNDGYQHQICTTNRGAEASTCSDKNMFTKRWAISPTFSSQVLAVAAIKEVGEARILRMFKTFHHVA